VTIHDGDRPADHVVQGRPGGGERCLHVEQGLAGLLGQRAADHGTVRPDRVLPAHVNGLRRTLDHHGLAEGGISDQRVGIEIRLHVTI
jgi:hypothetical protein